MSRWRGDVQCTMHNAQCTMHNAQCTMGEGAALEDDETTRRRDDEQSGLAFAKRLEARSCRLVSPSSRRPVVDGPESGAGLPGERPVDTIDRIDAIDEVGRGNAQCSMRNAEWGARPSAGRARAAHWSLKFKVGS